MLGDNHKDKSLKESKLLRRIPKHRIFVAQSSIGHPIVRSCFSWLSNSATANVALWSVQISESNQGKVMIVSAVEHGMTSLLIIHVNQGEN